MSKAILILDMPINCNNCPCFDCGDDRCCCNALNKDFTNEDTRIFDKDCPLKPLPKEREAFGILNDYERGKILGFNSCLKIILGEEE